MPILSSLAFNSRSAIPFPLILTVSHTARGEFTIANFESKYLYSVSGAGNPIVQNNKILVNAVDTDLTLTATVKGLSVTKMLYLRQYTYYSYYEGNYTMTQFYVHGAPCHAPTIPACPATCDGQWCIGACSTNGDNCNHQGGYSTCILRTGKNPTPSGYVDQFGEWSRVA